MRIICVNTGNKFSDWHTNNLKHMIDNYSGISYDNFEVIREENHTGVFNKLQMFDRFRDGENLYFDLDVCIYDKLPDLKRKKLTVLKAWWRDRQHTSLNSSIISWSGDYSHIYKKFLEDTKMYEKKYYRGIDQMLEEMFEPDTFKQVCYSVKGREYDTDKDKKFSMMLFNQKQYLMNEGWSSWWSSYFLPKS
jgi:hypothetical protein